MVEWVIPEPCLSIKAQAVLLSLNRTSLYRKAKESSEFEAYIKNLIDVLHTEKPLRDQDAFVMTSMTWSWALR